MYNKSLSTKEKIILSAKKMLSEKNIEDISIAEIASDAGVAVGLINYHFKTKENLFYEAIEYYIKENILEGNEVVNLLNLNSREQLIVSLKGFGDFLANNKKMCMLYFIKTLEKKDKKVVTQMGFDYYIPILKHLFPDKSNVDLIFIIYPIFSSIQMMFLYSDSFKETTNMDYFLKENRDEMIEKLVVNNLENYELKGKNEC